MRFDLLFVNFIALPASLLGSTSGSFQASGNDPRRSPIAGDQPNSVSLKLELGRAIVVLKKGLRENWGTRDQYLNAFQETSNADSKGRPVKDEKGYVECEIGEHLRKHQIWDEGPPIGLEVRGTIADFIGQREGQRARFQPSSCTFPPPRRVMVSAGVASGLLKTKVDPVYPAEALKKHVIGTVVLQAVIDARGRVVAPRIISGPISLQQAALDAVRLWTC